MPLLLAFGWRQLPKRSIGRKQRVDHAQTGDTFGMLANGSIPEVAPTVRPTADFFGRRIIRFVLPQCCRGPPAKQRIVHGVGVGLDVTAISAKHLRDRGACVLRLILEKDMVSVRQHHEEVTLATGLSFAVANECGLYGNSGGVRRKAKCLRFGFLSHRVHDGSECGASVFGISTHSATVELFALKPIQRLLSGKRHTEHILGYQQMRNQCRSEQRAAEQLLGRRGRDDLRGFIRARRQLVHCARNLDATHPATLVSKLPAIFKPDAFRFAFELWVRDLDSRERQLGLG